MPLTTLQLRIARTDLAAGTALTIDTHYRVALTAIRTLTFTGTPAEGSKTSLVIYSDGAYTLTIPASKRYGGADSVITSLAIPAGLNGLSWEYTNGGWVVADSLSSGDFIPSSYLDIDDTLAANSDVRVPSQQAVKAYVDANAGAPVYSLNVFANAASPASPSTVHFGLAPTLVPVTTANLRYRIIPKTGTITGANILAYANTTVGTAEDISVYIRINNTTDTLIATVGAATAGRSFRNMALSLGVTAGDTYEIKVVYPTWSTPPAGVYWSGELFMT